MHRSRKNLGRVQVDVNCEAPCFNIGKPEVTPLYLSAGNGWKDTCSLLIHLGAAMLADKDMSSPLQYSWNRTRAWWSPVHAAAYSGHKETVEMFLDEGVETDVTSQQGETPLFLAAEIGSVETVELLLDRGSDPTICRYLHIKWLTI